MVTPLKEAHGGERVKAEIEDITTSCQPNTQPPLRDENMVYDIHLLIFEKKVTPQRLVRKKFVTEVAVAGFSAVAGFVRSRNSIGRKP